jgi:hypothetical protein
MAPAWQAHAKNNNIAHLADFLMVLPKLLEVFSFTPANEKANLKTRRSRKTDFLCCRCKMKKKMVPK